jgi:hypothetical protein
MAHQPLSNIKIDVQQVVDGLKQPTFVGNAGDGSGVFSSWKKQD